VGLVRGNCALTRNVAYRCLRSVCGANFMVSYLGRFGLPTTGLQTIMATLSALFALAVLVQTGCYSSTECPRVRFSSSCNLSTTTSFIRRCCASNTAAMTNEFSLRSRNYSSKTNLLLVQKAFHGVKYHSNRLEQSPKPQSDHLRQH
jgi:4-aminobutyrate aminotransferase-like enzyme